MEPYVAKKLPHMYDMSRDIFKLLMDTKENYGEYKGYLKTMEYDYKYFLESLLINDIYFSFKIDGSKLQKEDMFHMPYRIKNNESLEFNNLKKVFLFGLSNITQNGVSIETINKMQKLLFDECKKDNKIKGSGHFRKKQTYILKPGLAGSSVSFVPPLYTEINPLMKNLCEYFNDKDSEIFSLVAFTHFQFERIHPYNTGNGKIGRIMIPIQSSYHKKEPPILFLSESMESLTNTYFTLLSSEKENELDLFMKFTLQCINDQCSNNIKKIKKLNKIYKQDMESFKEKIGGTTIYKVYPSIIKRIVFTTNDIVEETKLHINSINKVLNKLVESGYLIKEKRKGNNRVTFKYKNMLDIFVN